MPGLAAKPTFDVPARSGGSQRCAPVFGPKSGLSNLCPAMGDAKHGCSAESDPAEIPPIKTGPNWIDSGPSLARVGPHRHYLVEAGPNLATTDQIQPMTAKLELRPKLVELGRSWPKTHPESAQTTKVSGFGGDWANLGPNLARAGRQSSAEMLAGRGQAPPTRARGKRQRHHAGQDFSHSALVGS